MAAVSQPETAQSVTHVCSLLFFSYRHQKSKAEQRAISWGKNGECGVIVAAELPEWLRTEPRRRMNTLKGGKAAELNYMLEM